MSMNKQFHCSVRRDLKRFRVALDRPPAGDLDRASALHRAGANFRQQLTEHHESEHEIAWPAMKAVGVGDATIATFDEEHDAMATTHLDHEEGEAEQRLLDTHEDPAGKAMGKQFSRRAWASTGSF